ncbi:MAG: ABC-F family ATP-binding cassette domain-containing protein [Lachnospiraceae bacterium]|nr:ABC-F family ATP-binding cassette domain-containing protein [Lachnospiraceae bacterium]
MAKPERSLLTIEHVSKAFLTRELLKDVSVGISEGDKIGLIGINGTGKSTLLRIAAGELEPDEGQIIRSGDLRVSYLPQNPIFDPSKSVLENVAAAVSGKADHWDTLGEVRATLARFDIPDPDVSPETLSGGQKKRAALTAAILTPSDLLILDEPTNHLDSEMSGWLEDFLRSYRGAILMVTHDRYFLDAVTNQILEIDRGKAYRYHANYSGYLELRAERMDFARAAERKAAALYRQDLAWMMRGARARSTKQKAHIQRFEALRDRDRIVEDREVELQSLPSRLGGTTIEIDGIAKSYGEKTLFRDFTYHFLKTDRIGIIGRNGCGKTSLLRCMTGRLEPDAGSAVIGQTVKIGYFTQENESLNEDERVLDFIKDTAEYIRTADGLVSAGSMCERFLFDPEMQRALIGSLSGGEKRRLSLLKVLMENPNVLILDEPTNDLDIATLRILEDYLDHFAGIVITVSHDRYFLDRVVTRIFSFEPDGTIRQSEGGYEEYLAHRAAWYGEEEQGDGGKQKGNGSTGKKAAGKPGNTAGTDAAGKTEQQDTRSSWKQNTPRQKTKLSYMEQREYDTIEDVIAELEEKSAKLEADMAEAATSYSKLQELAEEKEETDRLLEEKLERYIELQELVESFENIKKS